ncbi:hypothetical protein RHGRI_025495 [Rhododendron griersonianum]|uniref:Uncharacterized protein n=1 Tax=Rhododendron griersonianum TaxID=479676 RepID=A0AAV6ISU7_9ERIC|nr:hypothetical protein RHGRI_025495 [Rhododendron griersonianum]
MPSSTTPPSMIVPTTTPIAIFPITMPHFYLTTMSTGPFYLPFLPAARTLLLLPILGGMPQPDVGSSQPPLSTAYTYNTYSNKLLDTVQTHPWVGACRSLTLARLTVCTPTTVCSWTMQARLCLMSKHGPGQTCLRRGRLLKLKPLFRCQLCLCEQILDFGARALTKN